MGLSGKKELSEIEAAGQFVLWVCESVKQQWPKISNEINTMFKEIGIEDALSEENLDAFEFILAVTAIQVQALPNLLPSDQALRIREIIIQCISSPDLGSYPRETIEEYQSAWDQSPQQGNRPWDGIASVLYDKLDFRSNVKLGSTNIKNPFVLMALGEKVLKFGGPYWKTVTEKCELVMMNDEL